MQRNLVSIALFGRLYQCCPFSLLTHCYSVQHVVRFLTQPEKHLCQGLMEVTSLEWQQNAKQLVDISCVAVLQQA